MQSLNKIPVSSRRSHLPHPFGPMPSFQYAQPPYPVLDHGSRYPSMTYGIPQEHCGSFQGYGPIIPQEHGFQYTESHDRYKQPPASGHMFDHSNDFGNPYMGLPMSAGVPTLPPLRTNERHPQRYPQSYGRRHQNEVQRYENPTKDDKAVGGVSAKLDYDMEQMTDFVAELTIGMYDLMNTHICAADIDLTRSIQPAVAVPHSFRKWVLQVLNATRLPSATILLSLSYLTLRVRGLYASGQFVPEERTVYQLLTVALILGSKFLDDNTFQNKSWAEVSNISVAELNKAEREWLSAFNHRLHHDANSVDGFSSWEEKWSAYKARAASVSAASMVAPDAMLMRQQSLRHSISPIIYQQQQFPHSLSHVPLAVEAADVAYGSPTYSPYGGWVAQGSAFDSSPSSASHTGPNTPDFYAAQSGWGTFEPYNARQSQSNFAPLSQPKSSMTGHQVPYPLGNYNLAGNAMWNCHSAACQCNGCRAQAHFFQPRFGPIVVG